MFNSRLYVYLRYKWHQIHSSFTDLMNVMSFHFQEFCFLHFHHEHFMQQWTLNWTMKEITYFHLLFTFFFMEGENCFQFETYFLWSNMPVLNVYGFTGRLPLVFPIQLFWVIIVVVRVHFCVLTLHMHCCVYHSDHKKSNFGGCA